MSVGCWEPLKEMENFSLGSIWDTDWRLIRDEHKEEQSSMSESKISLQEFFRKERKSQKILKVLIRGH